MRGSLRSWPPGSGHGAEVDPKQEMITIPLTVNGKEVSPAVPLTPAILNAIFDAVGVRIRRVPASPDIIKEALESQTAAEGAAVHVEAGCQGL